MAEIILANLRNIGLDVKAEMVDSTTIDAVTAKNEHSPLTLASISVGVQFIALWRNTRPEHMGNYGILDDPGLQALYDLLANHTPYAAERDRISKTIAIEGLKRASRVELPSGFYAVAWWPWLENYYGELEP